MLTIPRFAFNLTTYLAFPILTWETAGVDAGITGTDGIFGFTAYDADMKILHQRSPTKAEMGESESIEFSSNVESITFSTDSGDGFVGIVNVTIAGEEIFYSCIDCLVTSPSTILGKIYVDLESNGPQNLPETANCKETCTFTRVPGKFYLTVSNSFFNNESATVGF